MRNNVACLVQGCGNRFQGKGEMLQHMRECAEARHRGFVLPAATAKDLGICVCSKCWTLRPQSKFNKCFRHDCDEAERPEHLTGINPDCVLDQPPEPGPPGSRERGCSRAKRIRRECISDHSGSDTEKSRNEDVTTDSGESEATRRGRHSSFRRRPRAIKRARLDLGGALTLVERRMRSRSPASDRTSDSEDAQWDTADDEDAPSPGGVADSPGADPLDGNTIPDTGDGREAEPHDIPDAQGCRRYGPRARGTDQAAHQPEPARRPPGHDLLPIVHGGDPEEPTPPFGPDEDPPDPPNDRGEREAAPLPAQVPRPGQPARADAGPPPREAAVIMERPPKPFHQRVYEASKLLHDYNGATEVADKTRIILTLLKSPLHVSTHSTTFEDQMDDADADIEPDDVELPDNPPDESPGPTQERSPREIALNRLRLIQRMMDAKNVAAARRAIHAMPLPALTKEVETSIRALYPARTSEPTKTDVAAARGSVPWISADKIKAYVDTHSKIRKGKDVYGWTMPQLGTVLKGTARTKADGLTPLVGLARLVNDIVLHQVPDDALKALKRLRGCPLAKPTGGIRPISIEPVFMKMAAALLVQELASEISEALGPWEFGHGKKGSTEALTHLVRAHMSKHKDHVVLCVDMRNAFGTTPRNLVLEQTKDRVGKLLPLAAALLDTPSQVVIRDVNPERSFTIDMSEGTIQGSPTGGVLFSLAFRPVLDCVREECPDVLMPHYFDDLYIIAPLDRAMQAYSSLVDALPGGMLINRTKTILYAPDESVRQGAIEAAAAKEITCVHDGIVVCGAPVGTEDFESTHVEKWVDSVIASLDPLIDAAISPDSNTRLQMAMRVCRLCYASQINHLLRSVPPRSTVRAAKRFDDAILRVTLLMLATEGPPPDPAPPYWVALRERVLLPVSEGGLGFQKLESIAEAAFLGSLALVSNSVTTLLKLTDAEFGTLIDTWGYTTARDRLVHAHGISPTLIPGAAEVASDRIVRLQQALSANVSAHRSDAILVLLQQPPETADRPRDPAIDWMRTVHLHVRGSPTSGAFLLANPKLPLNRMTDAEFADAAKLYLGCLARTPQEVPPRCKSNGCRQAVLATPDHDLTCTCTGGTRNTRHHMVKFAFHRILKTFPSMKSTPPILEPRASTYYRVAPAQANAPAVQLHKKFAGTRFDEAVQLGDRTYLIDYTIVSPPLITADRAAAEAPALGGVDRKKRHYAEVLAGTASPDTQIVPLAFSALGRPDVWGLEFIRSMAKSLTHHDKAAYAFGYRRLLEAISIALWRGNSGAMRAYKATLGPTPRG